MYDIKVVNGTIIDGTGRPPFKGDVGISRGRLVDIGDAPDDGRRTVDATDLVVAPGFIDIHTHYDVQVFWDRWLTPTPWQGVTTIVMGNCGFGIAPTREADRARILHTLQHVEGMPYECTSAGLGDWGFESYPEYLDALERINPAINIASMIGHTALRTWVMGKDANARSEVNDAELAQMRHLVKEALAIGAAGFSTTDSPAHFGEGGIPVPSRWATIEELESIASVLAEMRMGTFHAKWGPVMSPEGFERIIRKTGVPVCDPGIGSFPPGLDDFQKPRMAMVAKLQDEGYTWFPQFSVLPNTFEVGLQDPFMFALDLPLGAMQVAPLNDLFVPVLNESDEVKLAAYSSTEFRRRFVEMTSGDDWARKYWPWVVVNYWPQRPEFEGRKLEDVASELGLHPAEVVLDMSVESDLEARLGVLAGNKYPQGVWDLLHSDRVRAGLGDAGAHIGMLCDARYPAHLLGYWVRQQGLDLERAVRMMTTMAAECYGIFDRGSLTAGLAADVCVFNPNTVIDGPLKRVNDLPAQTRRLLSEPVGIDYVIVNGTVLRDHNVDAVDPDGPLPGQILRRFLPHHLRQAQ